MTMTAQPRTIRAEIHGDAISRVSAFFNASLPQTLDEILQNARRAGATKVDITTTAGGVMTITDDGRGIENPDALLAFGLSDWDTDTDQREHPAGMGLYSLARREWTTITSRTPGGEPWTVTLHPEHFVGKAEATIREAPPETPNGTSVSFPHAQAGYETDRSLRRATGFYPLPVTHNGDPLPREDHLKDALFIRPWRGLRIGVYDRSPVHPLNFHGIIVQHTLPTVHTLEGNYGVRIDVRDCPDLELTLPARTGLVENDFLPELYTECVRTIYAALASMASRGHPVDVPHSVWTNAREKHGIQLPEARPLLRPWEPETASSRRPKPPPPAVTPPADAVVMKMNEPTPDQHALARAATAAGLAPRLYARNQSLQGYPWYDKLMKAEELTIAIVHDGQTTLLHKWRDHSEKGQEPPTVRPDAIQMTITGTDGAKNRMSASFPADLAFWNESQDSCPDENMPMATKDSDVTIPELVQLLTNAYFTPVYDHDTDSFDTQEDSHQEDSRLIATYLLSSPADALRANIAESVNRHIRYTIPQGTSVSIRLNGTAPPDITILEQAAPPDPQA